VAELIVGLGLSQKAGFPQGIGGAASTRGTRSTPTEFPRDMFVSGRVIMEDGTPPPEPAAIEVVCVAHRIPQTYTDSKGKFSFRLGEHQEVTSDASLGAGSDRDILGGRRGGRQSGSTTSMARAGAGMMGCDLHVALVGYRSDDVSLAQRNSMDHTDIGTIVLHRLANVEGTTISVTSASAPKQARAAFSKGSEAMQKRKLAEARKHFEKAVELYPKYSAAWFYIGVVCGQQKQTDEARRAFSKSIETDPTFVRPYLAIAQIAMQERNWPDVANYTDRLIKLDPVDFPQAYLMNALAYGGLNNLDAAEKSARAAVKLDKDHHFPRAEYVLGFILAKKSDYNGALGYMRSYLERVPNAPDADAIKREIAELEGAIGTIAATAKP